MFRNDRPKNDIAGPQWSGRRMIEVSLVKPPQGAAAPQGTEVALERLGAAPTFRLGHRQPPLKVFFWLPATSTSLISRCTSIFNFLRAVSTVRIELPRRVVHHGGRGCCALSSARDGTSSIADSHGGDGHNPTQRRGVNKAC